MIHALRGAIGRFQIKGQLIVPLCLVWSLILASCVETLPPPDFAGALGQDYRVIAVRSKTLYQDDILFQQPVNGAGSGAASGAAQATGEVLGGCGTGGASLLICLGLAPIAAIVGAIYGSIHAHSEREVAQASAKLKEGIAEAEPGPGIERAVVTRLRIAGSGRYEVRTLSGNELNLTSVELGEEGIDAILEIEVSRLDLAVFGRIDPDAAIILAVRAAMVDTRVGLTAPALTWAYHGAHHDYFELAGNDARLLRDSIIQSYEEVAELIVSKIF